MHLHSTADADDLLQETFVRLASAGRKLAKVENLNAYVFVVARNEVARLRKRRSREPRRRAADAEFAKASDSAGETKEMLAKALEQLPPDQREIVELKAFAGLTLREIASVTEAPPGTVATRYRAALARLRELLKETYHD
jgi:RNA polymerase sigma-70 factor (ECF subfamily)